MNPARSSSGGAAGVILRGRFGMEVANLHMNRPVGPPMVLTRGEEGHILDLDHQPAGQGPWGGGYSYRPRPWYLVPETFWI